MKIADLLDLVNGSDPEMKVWFVRKDGPVVAIEDGCVTIDPEGKPCILLYEAESNCT